MEKIREKIYQKFELQKLSPLEQADKLPRLINGVLHSVLLRILPGLKEDELEEYDRLTKGGEGMALLRFLQDKVSNLEQIVDEEIEILHTEIRG